MKNERHNEMNLAQRAWALRLRSPARARELAHQALLNERQPEIAADAAATLALLARWQGHFKPALEYCDRSEALLKGYQRYSLRACLAAIRARVYLDNGDISEACHQTGIGLDMLRAAKMRAPEAKIALMMLVAALHRTAGERDEAQEMLEEALLVCQRDNLIDFEAWVLHEIAATLYGKGDFAASKVMAQKSRDLACRTRSRAIIPHIDATLASLQIGNTPAQEVSDNLHIALSDARRLGDLRAEVKLLAALARNGLAHGKFDCAMRKLDQATRLAIEIGYNARMLMLHKMQAETHEAAGNFREALESRKAFDAVRHSTARTAAKATLRAMKARADLVAAQIEIDASRLKAEDLTARAREALLASRQKSHFLANMSHELRTPLNGVLGFTQLLQMSQLDDKQREYADLAVQAGEALLVLINDILDISRIEAGVIALTTDEFSVSAMLDQVYATIKGLAAHKGLDVAFDIADDTPKFMTSDRQRLVQVLVNFAGNAVKFTESGTVTLHARAGENGIRFAVSDSGPGISHEDRERVFDRFFRADSSMTRRHEGIGLGLAISAELTMLMNGTIGVADAEGGGAEFWVDMPLTIDNEQLDEAVAQHRGVA